MQKIIQDKKLLGIAAAALVAFLLGIWCFGINTPAYAVFINGKKQFIVKDAGSVEKVLNQMTKDQSKGHKQVELSSKVDLKRTFVKRESILPIAKVEPELKKSLQFKTLAAAIIINGKTITYVDNKSVAQKILRQIKDENSRLEEGEKLISVSVAEKVEIKETRAALSRVLSREGAWNLITTRYSQSGKIHNQEGDNLWSIARKNDMYELISQTQIISVKMKFWIWVRRKILIKSKPYIMSCQDRRQ